MLASSKLVGFVVTTDPDRSREFYEHVLGLEFVADEPFALVFESNGNRIRIARRETLDPQPFTVMGWEVDDVAATVRALTGRGVSFERYPGMAQDDVGIWSPPGSTHGVAWFKDPDGNLLSISGPNGSG